MKTKILVLCTGNSCRSQMAEGFLKSFDNELKVLSAGTNPAPRISSKAIEVMKELNIDISNNKPNDVSEFLSESFDYVITVCDKAKETCPVFSGKVKHRLHIGFEDPTEASGTPEQVIAFYRRIRDEIWCQFKELYINEIRK